jgi:cupin fold WbuC family metalloprotein
MTTTSTVLFTQDTICTAAPELLEQLKKLAQKAPLQRARYCMHLSHDDPIQEMIIALHGNPYIRPHRHPNKSESFHMIEGEVIVAFFDDSGFIIKKIYLSSKKDRPFLYRLSSPLWHTVVSLTEYCVFHEVITGPFSQAEYPAWEPHDDPQSIQLFHQKILKADI